MKARLPWLLLAAWFAPAFPSAAQTVTDAAGLAAPLDHLQGSARDLALGSAFVGVADDASALFFNPAGLASVGRPEAALHHNSYLAGTFQETLAGALPLGGGGGLALALDYVNWGTLDLRDPFGAPEGDFNDSDVGLTLGWGQEWAPGLSLGIALRGLQQKVVNDLYNSLAGDLGILWTPGGGWRLGAAWANLGTPVAGSPLEQEMRLGASFDADLSPQVGLLTALAGDWVPGGPGELRAGMEGTLNGRWALRVGCQVPLQDDQISGFAHFTAGAGMKLSSFTLDYAYVPFGDLGTSHRLSLTYQFDLPRREVAVPVTILQPVPAPQAPGGQDLQMEFKIPGQTDALSQGKDLEQQGKDAQAAQAYVEALKADPQDDRLWDALGRLYYRLGKKDYAVRCFERELAITGGNQALRRWLEDYKAR